MTEEMLLKRLYKKVVPVVAIKSIEHAKFVADYLVDNGYDSIEITFRTDVAADAIRFIKANYDLLVGAGTVLDVDTARTAIECGADFIVSPGFLDDTVKYCDSVGVIILPGVETASEINKAISYGKTFLKFFPAEAAGGISKIKALSAPYKNVKFMPTGGINKDNVNDYLALDCVVCCGGSYIVPEFNK